MRLSFRSAAFWKVVFSAAVACSPPVATASTLDLNCVGTPASNAITTILVIDLSTKTVNYRLEDEKKGDSLPADIGKDTISWFDVESQYFYVLDRKTNRLILTMEKNVVAGEENHHVRFVTGVYDCSSFH